MNNTFLIDVRLTEKQFLQFSSFDMFVRTKRFVNMVLLAVIMLVFAIICFTRPDGIFLGIVLLVVGFGLPLFYYFNYMSMLKKQARNFGIDKGKSLYVVELSNEANGICVKAEDGQEVCYEWSACSHVYLKGELIYLYVLKNRALVLPIEKATGGTKEELIAIISSKFDKKQITHNK